MTPVRFPEQNVVFAEDQPQYQPLPAYRGPAPVGEVISCWRLTWRERLRLLVRGRLWLRQLTFGDLLQPQLPTTERPFL